ncbi:C-Myc binding protein [Seminavis robusta]|uniref:c-Myc binding protein n=1 Tax=Seminavis robusta TaxID=568900 RepID=A0A9N8DFQ6_9STRA|nr:C-Myc binding protein [Seminavis robusta]|eukprot:Sro103_g052350.1 C-Myc binding protein (103) ;mRNA; f:19701-20214
MTTYNNSNNSGGGNNNNNNNNNNTDYSKKEEFRRYLEKTGVLDALTKVLVGLYEEPERPGNAIGYIKQYMGAPTNVDVEGLQKENAELKRQIEKLRKQAGEK